MTTTHVFVYEVQVDGRTGAFFDQGLLITPWLVVLGNRASRVVAANPGWYDNLRCQIVSGSEPTQTYDGQLSAPQKNTVPPAVFLHYAARAALDPVDWDEVRRKPTLLRAAVSRNEVSRDKMPPPPDGAEQGDSDGRDDPQLGLPSDSAVAAAAARPPWCYLWRKGPGCAA